MSRKLRRVLAAACLLVVLYLSYDLWQLNAREQLWGHRPLFLFLAGWLGVVLLWLPRFTPDERRDRWFYYSTATGVLLALGFPPLPGQFLLFGAFVPLLVVESEISRSYETPRKATVFRYALHAFVLWNILATFWVANTAFVAGIVANLLNALFMCAPFVAYHVSSRYLPNLRLPAFVGFWLAFEYLHLNWEITWPWLNLGNAFGRVPAWVQWYEITGTFGGALWVLVVNVLLLRTVEKWQLRGAWDRQRLLVAAVVVGLPLLGSFARYFTYTERGETTEVVVVQPDYEPHFVKPRVPAAKLLRDAERLAATALTPETDYLLFPESAFGRVDSAQIGRDAATGPLRRFFEQYPDLNLVTGISSYHILGDDEPDTRALRIQERNGRRTRWEAYNAAAQLNGRNESVQLHLKEKLVPGAEFMPYRRVFAFLEPLADKLGGSLAGYGRYEQPTVFRSPAGTVAPVICYESIYGEYNSKYTARGSEAIFILTKDGWWDRTAGHLQHLHYARLRAVEQRRDVVRAVNRGVSAFINQRGDLVQRTRYAEARALRGTVRRNSTTTFYARWGDLIGRLSLFLVAIVVLMSLSRWWQHRVGARKEL